MKTRPELSSYLKVTYDREVDILWMRIPGRKILVSSDIGGPLVIDFGTEDESGDVVGVELHRASEFLAPMLESLKAEAV